MHRAGFVIYASKTDTEESFG